MLSVVMLSAFMLSVVMLSAFMLSVVMLNVIMLIVMAPCQHRLSDHENDIILNLFQN
jgi:hypothetical protein